MTILLHGTDEDVLEIRDETGEALYLAAVDQCAQQVSGLLAVLQFEKPFVTERVNICQDSP